MTGREAIEAYLRRYPTFRIRDVVARTGASENAVGMAIYRMRQEGLLTVSSQDGRYPIFRQSTEEERDRLIEMAVNRITGRQAIRLWLKSHETMTSAQVAHRYGLSVSMIRQASRKLFVEGGLVIVIGGSREVVYGRLGVDVAALRRQLLTPDANYWGHILSADAGEDGEGSVTEPLAGLNEDDLDEVTYDASGANNVFAECRENWAGYQVHKIFGSAGRV